MTDEDRQLIDDWQTAGLPCRMIATHRRRTATRGYVALLLLAGLTGFLSAAAVLQHNEHIDRPAIVVPETPPSLTRTNTPG